MARIDLQKTEPPTSPEGPIDAAAGHGDPGDLAPEPLLERRPPGSQAEARPSSIIANLPLPRLVVPTSVPLTQFPGSAGVKVRPAARDFLLLPLRQQILGRAGLGFGRAIRETLIDEAVFARLEWAAHLRPEPGLGQRRPVGRDQLAIEPGRAVAGDLPIEIVGRENAKVHSPALRRVIGGGARPIANRAWRRGPPRSGPSRRRSSRANPWVGKPGYNLTTDMADEAIK